MKKHTYVLFIFLVLATFIVVWREPLIFYSARFGFKYCAEKMLNEKVNFKQFILDKKRITLIGPSIGTKEQILDDGGVYLQAQSLSIDFDFDLFKRRVCLDLNLSNPHVLVVKTATHKPSFFELFQKKSNLVDLSARVKVSDGELEMIDCFSAKEKWMQQLFFTVETKHATLDQTEIEINLGHESSQYNSVICLKENVIDYRLSLDNVEVSQFHNIVDFWSSLRPKENRSLNFSKGRLDGSLNLCLIPHYFPVLKTQLKVQELILEDKKTLLSTHVPQVNVAIETGNVQREGSSYKGKDLLDLLLVHSTGVIEIPFGAEVLYQKNQIEILKSLDMKGEIILQENQAAKLRFQGNVSTGSRYSLITLDGAGFLTRLDGYLNLKMKNDDKKEASLCCSINSYNPSQHQFYSQISNFSEAEADFVQQLLRPFYPQVTGLEIQKGLLNASVKCLFNEGRIQNIDVENFNLKEGDFNYFEWIQSAKNVEANGGLKISFASQNPLKNLDGKVYFQANQLIGEKNTFENLKGYSQFLEGKLIASHAKGDYSGLTVNAKWGVENVSPLFISLKGRGQDFIKHVPENMRCVYQPIFEEEKFEVDLWGETSKDQLRLNGKCIIGNKKPADFGLSLVKRLPVDDSQEQFKLFWKNYITPMKANPSLSYFERKMGLNLNSKYTIQDGWFRLTEVPVEEYLSPLLFKDTTIELEGTADFNGTFDQQGLSLSYKNYCLKFDHQHISIDVVAEPHEVGRHYFNFNQQTHFGSVPMSQASCFIKSGQLKLENTSGKVDIMPGCIFAREIKAQINDLEISSEFKLSFSPLGEVDLMLKLSELTGPLEGFKQVFNSLETSFFNNLPIDGTLEMVPENSYFHLVNKDKLTTRVVLEGRLFNGQSSVIGSQPLSDISFDFKFDSDTSLFELNNFKSSWKSHRNQIYGFHSNYLKVNLFADEPCFFDVKIKNSYKDCARLVGKLYLNLAQTHPTLKVILDQKDNHVGSLGLSNVYFSLNQAFHLDYLNVNFSCNLESINQDISLMQNLLPQISSHSLTALKWMNLKGDLSGQWVFDLNQDQHQFCIWGDQVKIAQSSEGFFQLKGHRKGRFTVIEDFTHQQLKGSCQLEERPLCHFIHQLKLHAGNDLDLSASGIYCKIFHSFQAQIDHFSCDMEQIKQLQFFSSIPFLNESFGKMDLKGKSEGGLYKGGLNYRLEFSGKTMGLKVKDVLFDDDQVKCVLKGDSQKINIEHFESRFLEAYKTPLRLKFSGDNMEFAKGANLKRVGNIHFSIPANSLLSVQNILAQHWNLEIPKRAFEIKEEGLVQGNLSFNPLDAHYTLGLKLDEGDYKVFNQTCHLDECQLDYGPLGLKIGAKTLINEQPYWLGYHKDSSKKDSFTLSVYDHHPQPLTQSSNLSIECLEQGPSFLIKNMKGTIAGMRWDFVHRPDKDSSLDNVLMGQLQIEGEELVKRLPPKISQVLSRYQFGKGYFLTGQLTLPKNNLKDFVFDGLFGGQDFDLLGYEFKSLSSSVRATLDNLFIKDLKISDLSGEVSMNQLRLEKGPQKVNLNIPTIELKEFKPSLLHSSQKGPQKHKPLIIDSLKINGVGGNLLDLQSLVGSGEFSFQKSPKKQASLLDVPAHLISKLGLDLTMLNPVEGKITFEIKDQKVVFTKFIDVYSHDRHCHFTLAKHPHVSFMDFKGDLNIKIKMKQYVLLKITEPFIISIQGSCLSPRYSFMKKKVVVDVPEKAPF